MKMLLDALILSLCCALAFASPAAAQLYGLTPVVTSTGAAASLVAKAAPGSLLQATATSVTATAGYLVGYNAIAAPADGTLDATLVIDCVRIAANGTAQINNQPGPATNYTIGITLIVTSAATCYTKTTGVVTAYIGAKVQ